MGNASRKEKSLFEDFSFFTLNKLEGKSKNKVLYVFTDPLQYPDSGLLILTNQTVVNYSESKKNPLTFFESQEKIISAVFIPSKPLQPPRTTEPILILALENKTLHFLHGKSLLTYKNISPPTIPLESLKISESASINSSQVDPFKNLYINSILLKNENTLLIGYENGFVQEYDTAKEKTKLVFNPAAYQLNENPDFPLFSVKSAATEEKPVKEESKSEEGEEGLGSSPKKSPLLESYLLPGIDSMNYCMLDNNLIVNHRPTFTNSEGTKYEFVETLIFLYGEDGGAPYKRLKGCKGSIIYSKILQDRRLYTAMTEENEIYVWNYILDSLVMKIPILTIGIMNKPDLHFSAFCIHEFDLHHKNTPVKDVWAYNVDWKRIQDVPVVDGDYIISAEKDGSLFLSKLIFENEKGEFNWLASKILGSQGNMKKKESKKASSIDVIHYEKIDDTLYLIDQDYNIRIFKNIMKHLHEPVIKQSK